MPLERNIISRILNQLKDKHGLTHKSWAEKSGVPVGTVSRYLGYNVGVPNFAHICAMLNCIGESVDDFYILISNTTDDVNAAGIVAPARDASIARRDQRHIETMTELKQERKSNKRLIIALITLIVVVVGLATVYIWDVSNLHKGLTSLIHDI